MRSAIDIIHHVYMAITINDTLKCDQFIKMTVVVIVLLDAQIMVIKICDMYLENRLFEYHRLFHQYKMLDCMKCSFQLR